MFKFVQPVYRVISRFKILLPLVLALFAKNAFSHPDQDDVNRNHFPNLYNKIKGINDLTPYQELHSLLIYSNEMLLFELYLPGNNDIIDFENGIVRIPSEEVKTWKADEFHYVASVNKTLTAIVVGMLLDEFQIPYTVKLSELMELTPRQIHQCRRLANVSLGELLAMKSPWVWDEWQGDDLKRLWQQNNFQHFLFSKPCQQENDWRYNSAVPNVIYSLFSEKVDERYQISLHAWIHQRLFKPLGIINYRWDQQPNGVVEASARLFMTPRDMLKIGQLMLNLGMWHKQKLVSEDWIQAMIKPLSETGLGHYGYLVWLREYAGEPAWVMEGDGGQYVIILPKLGAVIVMTQGNYSEWRVYPKQASEMLTEYIIPKLRTLNRSEIVH